jgi:transposase
MILGGRRATVYAYTQPVDMRKGFDGLAAVVEQHLGRSPVSGDLFLFVSRDRVRAKVLLWDGTGLCVLAKRLERGRFTLWRRESTNGTVQMTASELALFLEGCKVVGQQTLSPPEVNPHHPLANRLQL